MQELKIEQQFSGLDLGEHFHNSKNSLKGFKEKVEELRLLTSQPNNFIVEHFSKLRSDVDTEKERLKQQIEKHSLALINEVNEIEASCKTNTKVIPKHKEDIEKFDKSFTRLLEELNVLKIDIKKWDSISFESNRERIKLEQILEDLRAEILSMKLYYFESTLNLDENLKEMTIVKGGLKQKVETFNEFGSFHFTIQEFKKFTETESAQFWSNNYIFNDLKWYARMKNKDGENLSVDIYCDRKNQNQEISATLGFQLNNPQMPFKNEFLQVYNVYKSDRGHGFPKFISFKEIFENEFWDKENDVINMTFYVHVEKIRE